MKLKKILLTILILSSVLSYATNSLRIIDPQWSWWYNYSAEIKNAELVIHPAGGFIENDLTLEIGLANPFTQNGLQLEILMEFNLPANSMITDSWLWIEGVPKQADILDRWTASAIYEEIVDRRKDPSLLVKNSANQYAVNIYPLKPNETRKFKITYLTPIDYSGNEIICGYPFNILRTSSSAISHLTVLAFPNNQFTNPSVKYGTSDFNLVNDEQLGACYKAIIPFNDFGKSQIAFDNSNSHPIKVYNYHEGDEGYYQLSFIPSAVFDIPSSAEKICYLIDYDENYLNISKKDLISIFKNSLTGNYTSRDSFNIIFSSLTLDQAFDTWKPITEQNLSDALSDANLSNYSNLIQLMVKGITYINSTGGKGKIVLLSNNSVFQGLDNSNNILKDINRLNSNNIPIDVINYADNYYNYYWIANSSFYGNSYLYTNIARTNSGEYLSFYERISGNSFSELLTNALKDVSDQAIGNIDVYTNLDNGYCFGRTNYSSSSSQNFSMNVPVNQLGKYNGSFPLIVEISAKINNEIIHQEITVEEMEIIPVDSIMKTAWTGFDIMQLETESQSSQIINEIIFESVDNRILSLYTAFLCLEDTIPVCEDCGENGEGPITTSSELEKLTIKAYPNPFINHVEFTLEKSDQLEKIEIYNVSGQKIKEISIEEGCSTYSWDGKDEQEGVVKPGIYLVVARYGNKILTLKIQKV